MIKIIALVIWSIVGTLTFLDNGHPTKFDYGLVWITLIANILVRFVE